MSISATTLPGSSAELPLRRIKKPYLLLIGDMTDRKHAKTALGLKDWCPEDCIGQLRLSADAVDVGLPDMTPAEARAAGGETIVVGITPAGGKLPAAWRPTLIEALEAGLDIASGLHSRLDADPEIAARAESLGRTLHDVRHSDQAFDVGTGRPRPGKRMLMVGTDCAIGKKYTALAIHRALRARGANVDFRATGQTGILIAGRGVAVDSVVTDFISGAAEALSPANDPEHWDIIEGQGSLYHPSFAAVTLGLVHGSQPDLMVLCHHPGRAHIAGHTDFAIPSLSEAVRLYTDLARLTSPNVRVAGISLTTADLDEEAARASLAEATKQTGLPAFDPIRFGLEEFVTGLGIT